MSRRKKKDHSWADIQILEPSIPIDKLENEIRKYNPASYPAFNELIKIFTEKKINSIIVLGLGDMCTEISARKQISFILSIIEKFDIKNIRFYDPISCKNCNGFLESKGFHIDSENLYGQYEASPNSAFFIFHGPHFLYHNLITTNLTPDKLANIVIIGNSIENSRNLKNSSGFIMGEAFDAGILNETMLNFNHDPSFDNTALITAQTENFPPLDNKIWSKRQIIISDGEK
ncbi:hypothetical protein TVAG_475330 [Trichomonas vaginalis G3]|uniref:SRR1-like domain-containing protein n=1 Tax=Trichomonas vaginalis (strain ATCC PRA-98 / G3) TaxID=412133 RepID=A2EM40_TRIV3|nr:rhythmic process [Trichomonas vaginalis G3]EAY06299.1 hypothetical protein TVAG_475330 [Trichomonas vaginalis G3]KAI5503377.1 rhythmic process [Trichomonas vaginalis G3]|eukprot:XP_001318522.1 hypothetical protein [Trichomonas vaginalis G3]